MIQFLPQIISDNSKKHPDFNYYLSIIEKANTNIKIHPDIAIETCKSLIEGMSKSILIKTNEKYTEQRLKDSNVKDLFRMICEEMDLELEFTRQGYNLVKRMGEIRNDSGDISHGKPSPKSISNSISTALMISRVTDSISTYFLAEFFARDFTFKNVVSYEENEEFNEFLDEQNPDGYVVYSKALYDQDPVAYVGIIGELFR